MKVAVVLVALLGSWTAIAAAQPRTGRRDGAQTAAQAPVLPSYLAQAYDQFLLARHFESEDKIDEAVSAYKRAMALDPSAAEIPASLANLYLHHNKVEEAVSTAEQALKIDPENREANEVLGLVYAAMSDSGRRGANRRGQAAADDENVTKAISHLEQALAGAIGGGDPNTRATLARVYLRAGAFDKAIPLLSDLVEEEPSWDEGPALLAEAYAGAGRQDDAIRWLERAAPSDPQAYATLAEFYERERRWKDAADAYAKVLEIAPKSVELKTRYASALLNAGGRENASRARDVLNELLEEHPNEPRILYLTSQSERRLGDFDAAEQTARRLIAASPRTPWGYRALAEALEQRRQYQGVVDALAPAAEQFRSRSADEPLGLTLLLPHLGFAYQQLGQNDKAIAAFEEAHRLAPTDEVITGYLIDANISAKRYAQALDLARAARKETPDEIRFARLEAQALQKSGKAADGAAVLEGFLDQHRDSPEAYIVLAQYDVGADRGAQAVTLLQDAATKFPDDTTIPFQLGATFDRLKRFPEAEAQLRAVIAREPDNAQALNYLGYMLAERGERLNESVDLVSKALELDPDNGSYLDSLGWAYYKADKLDLAEENLRRAADQLKTNSVVQAHYGDALFKLRRYDDAIAAWTRALGGDREEIDPKDINRKIDSARKKLGKR